jgi:hypothetical protein
VLLATLALLAAAGGCTGGQDGGPTTAATATTTTAPAATTTTLPAATPVPVRAYFLRNEPTRQVVQPVARTSPDAGVARAAVEALIAGPDDGERQLGLGSAVPPATRLLGLSIQDRTAVVNLSSEFGSGGGSASMIGRAAQVVFTLTQFPTVDAVIFELDGRRPAVLGGEGLVLDGPQRRTDWEDSSPAILIESPLPFADVTGPLAVTGTANTFEATFQLNITDGEGLIVYDHTVTATSGTGTRGTFDVTATFAVPRPGTGSVIAFEHSARDGSRINIVEVPVRIGARR